jgi:catechol 2,3-dioxygenase-like lactoylglutathione lyase family enzyme
MVKTRETAMPVIKVTDIAWGRVRAPDLDQAEAFLADFGMVRAARTKTALYMRGTDPAHHIHVTDLGEPGHIGLAFRAASADDLAKLARLEGASPVETIDEPGGGKRVRLKDPDGYQVEVVHGIEVLAPIKVERPALNWGNERLRRAGALCRLPRGPSRVKRIGHGVIMTQDIKRALGWYRETLGLICSDDVYADDKSNLVGSFNRCDRGDEYVDHHAFFCIKGERVGLNHLSFEVADIDDVMIGHEHLQAKGHRHVWGIGRHLLGSQIFDYWADPWGRVHEHWTDTDMLNAKSPPGLVSRTELAGPWGEPIPMSFAQHATP